MPRVLVTGGTGFIGSNLSLELERLGHEVIVVDRHLSLDKKLPDFKGKVLEWDVVDPLRIDGDIDFIFHQAALTDPRYSNDAEILDKNIRGFENMLAFAAVKKAKLIYASTAGLYGNGPVPMQEDQEKQILTAYGLSKLKMDEMTELLMASRAVVGLRYFNVFGPREAHKGRPASMVYHLNKQMNETNVARLFKHGEQQRDFIYVKDVVSANLCAMNAPSGIYNVGTGVGTTFNRLVEILNEARGSSCKIEYFDMPFDPKTYQANTVADTRKAESILNFRASWELKDAIRDYLNWLSLPGKA